MKLTRHSGTPKPEGKLCLENSRNERNPTDYRFRITAYCSFALSAGPLEIEGCAKEAETPPRDGQKRKPKWNVGGLLERMAGPE